MWITEHLALIPQRRRVRPEQTECFTEVPPWAVQILFHVGTLILATQWPQFRPILPRSALVSNLSHNTQVPPFCDRLSPTHVLAPLGSQVREITKHTQQHFATSLQLAKPQVGTIINPGLKNRIYLWNLGILYNWCHLNTQFKWSMTLVLLKVH